jgi:hypothetical protein
MDRLVSALIWTMTALVVILGLFYVSLVWLFTAAFDEARYRAGRAFRHLAVAGTRHCMAKKSFLFRRARAKARVLAPVPTEGLTSADVPHLKEKVRAIIDTERKVLQRELAAGSGS